jgi:hypothetical protein
MSNCMSRQTQIGLLVLVSISASLCDTASAIPRRRRANYTNYSGGITQVATKSNETTEEYPTLQTYFDYDAAQDEAVAFKNKIRVFMNVWDKEILESDEALIAEVKITDTSNYEESYIRRVPITLNDVAGEDYKVATFDVDNVRGEQLVIRPKTVYRLFVSLHRDAEELSDSTVWGRLPGPYYAVTSGKTRLARARHKIVMRTFREWYYTERGWNRNAEYPMDCHAYYRWATGSCTVRSNNGWANVDSLFGSYHNGSQISELTQSEKIHGDYVRIPGHTFMLLSYDADKGHVWTMEANFGNTIEICIRSVGSGWTVGHLKSEHIREDIFPPAADSAETKEDDANVEVSMIQQTEPPIQ